MKQNHPQSSLPPGFRFHPTDEELILHYLKKKVTSSPFPLSIIADVDIYKFDPWDLPAKAALGEKEWYFFSPRDRKYPNGARPNRAAASGYWKATGTDKVIVSSTIMSGSSGFVGQQNIGVKKALVFYKGRPPKGVKTNWIMHEYRLADHVSNYNNSSSSNSNNKAIKPKDSSMRLDDWVLCRIYKKSHALTPSAVAATCNGQDQEEEEEQIVQETLLPSLKSPISNKTLMPQKSTSFSNLLDAVDFSVLSNFLSDTTGYEPYPALNTSATATTFDQSFFNNSCNTTASNCSSNYLLQKLPHQLNNSLPNMEVNKLKRELSNIDHEDASAMHPSKKVINSCSFSTNNSSSTQINDHMAQHNFLNQPLILNHHLLLSPHFQFQG